MKSSKEYEIHFIIKFSHPSLNDQCLPSYPKTNYTSHSLYEILHQTILCSLEETRYLVSLEISKCHHPHHLFLWSILPDKTSLINIKFSLANLIHGRSRICIIVYRTLYWCRRKALISLPRIIQTKSNRLVDNSVKIQISPECIGELERNLHAWLKM